MEFGIWEVENHAVSRSCQKHTVRISTKSERVFDVGGMSVISGTVVVFIELYILYEFLKSPTQRTDSAVSPLHVAPVLPTHVEQHRLPLS